MDITLDDNAGPFDGGNAVLGDEAMQAIRAQQKQIAQLHRLVMHLDVDRRTDLRSGA